MQLHSFQAFFMYRDASPAVFSFCLHRQTDRPKPPVGPAFIRPSAPISAARLPARIGCTSPNGTASASRSSRSGASFGSIRADYTERLPGMRKAFAAALPVVSAIIDGELYLVDLPARHGSGTHVVCATKSSLPYEGSCHNAAGSPQRMLGTCGDSPATAVV